MLNQLEFDYLRRDVISFKSKIWFSFLEIDLMFLSTLKQKCIKGSVR